MPVLGTDSESIGKLTALCEGLTSHLSCSSLSRCITVMGGGRNFLFKRFIPCQDSWSTVRVVVDSDRLLDTQELTPLVEW